MRVTSACRASTFEPVVAGRRGHRDDLLREHVERVARHDGRLDLPLAHALGDHRALDQVGAELREDPALRRVADVVAGAADPLQPGGDRLRRLDLQHEVDRAHVDAQLEARGGDQARQLAGLQQVLDEQALLARQRAVVGARDRLLGELVEPQREPLGAAAVVDEDQRRAVLAHQLQQLGVDRRPDRLARGLVAGALERVELDARRRPARPSTRPARGSSGRAACARRCRRSCTCAWGRPGSGRPPRAGSAWPTGRSAGRRARPPRRAARA